MSDYLTAYRKRHSCETTLLMSTEKWNNAIDNGESVGLLSTDMSKAFDCLNHRLLLGKLEAYSFDTDSIRLMSSYFKARFNRLRIGETTSSWKCVKRGCPQGSSFSPLLWNLFQNDLTFLMRSNVSTCLLTIIKFMKLIKTLATFKLNYRPVLKKQLVGMSQIHLRAIMDPCL